MPPSAGGRARVISGPQRPHLSISGFLSRIRDPQGDACPDRFLVSEAPKCHRGSRGVQSLNCGGSPENPANAFDLREWAP